MKLDLDNKTKAVEDATNKLKEKDVAISNLRKSSLRNQIMEAATKYKAYNPIQIMGLLQNEFEYDENLDKFSKHIKDDKGKLVDMESVDDVVKKFLSDKINDNLVRSGVTTDNLNIDDDDKNINKDLNKDKNLPKAKNYDPKDPILLKEADGAGFESVEGYIATLKLKDAKLAKIEERRIKK
jgi:hypothetical protein